MDHVVHLAKTPRGETKKNNGGTSGFAFLFCFFLKYLKGRVLWRFLGRFLGFFSILKDMEVCLSILKDMEVEVFL